MALQETAICGQMLGDEPGACLGQDGRIGFLQGTLRHFLACSCTEGWQPSIARRLDAHHTSRRFIDLTAASTCPLTVGNAVRTSDVQPPSPREKT